MAGYTARGRSDRRHRHAPDIQYDRTRGGELARSWYKNGTKYFKRHTTVQCVNDGAHLHLGCLSVPALESVPKMVRALMDRCMVDGIRIKLRLFDCEFSTKNISSLNELSANYLMPCRNTHRVVEGLRHFAADPRRDILSRTLAGSDRGRLQHGRRGTQLIDSNTAI